jgi:hypothetical protein
LDINDSLFALMLCQACNQRLATVHIGTRFPDRVEERALCPVCSGQKTETQLAQEEAEINSYGRDARTRAAEATERIFEPFMGRCKELGIQTRGRCFFGKIILIGINSMRNDVDPFECLFGQSARGKKHVSRVSEAFEMQIVRWSPDPGEYLKNLFEPFGSGRAVLHEDTRTITVRDEDSLFPQIQQSRDFCSAAAAALTIGNPQRIEYSFRSLIRPTNLRCS